MHGPPPPPLTKAQFDKCIAEGKDPFEVGGLNAWRRRNHRLFVAQAISIAFGAAVLLAIVIALAIRSVI